MNGLETIVAAMIVVIGGAFAYQRQKKIDRLEALIEQRKKVYKRFIDSVFEHAEMRNTETRYAYDFSKSEMMLIASDRVLEEMVSLQEMITMDDNATGPIDVGYASLSVIREMRKDCYESTKITDDKLAYISGIGRPTPLRGSQEGHFEPD